LVGTSRPTIEGYAIVSVDSMIADASGNMGALKFDADQKFFLASLDAAAAVMAAILEKADPRRCATIG